jgi:hypothetical protein
MSLVRASLTTRKTRWQKVKGAPEIELKRKKEKSII